MTKLAILDVGHGNSAVLDDEGIVVIDAGPQAGLLEYLRESEITEINVVLLSHADEDHIAGLLGLLASAEFKIKRVYLNTDSLKTSRIWDDLLYELDLLKRSGQIELGTSLTSGMTGQFDQGSVQIEILGPSSYLAARGPGSRDRLGRKIGTNSVSAVIRLVKGGQPIALLPGDLDEIGLDALMERGIDMRAPILVFPHHGGRAGNAADMVNFTNRICELVKPERVIFSIGHGNSYPRLDVVETIRTFNPNIKIACTQLSKQCAGVLPKNNPHHIRVFSKGAEYHRCCAGTIVLDLDAHLWLPNDDEHQSFIANFALTALCQR